jgi:hypothetical protein
MVGSSKILTVSYGTFSCTLEGFDDSFETMKAIAEYFRDLAADDRYFGAEPPTPDADMLARIAEREISRRVEAHEHEGRIVLRAQDNAAAGRALASALAAAPGAVADPETKPEAAATSETETAQATEAAPEPGSDTTSAPDATPGAESIAPPDAAPEFAASPADDSLMPEGLERENQPDTSEIPQAEEDGAAGLIVQQADEAGAPPAAEADDLTARLDLIRSAVGAADAYDEDEHAQDFTGTAGAEPMIWDDADGDEDDAAAPADTPVSAQADHGGDTGTAAEENSPFEDTLAALLADAMPADARTQEAPETGTAETGSVDPVEEDDPRRARVLKVSRADVEAAREGGLLDAMDEDGEDTVNIFGDDAAALSPADEAELQRELARLDAELGTDIAEAAETATDPEAPVAANKSPAPEPEPAAQDRTGKRTEMSRIFDETDSQMADPGSVRRRNTIQHLRAALAATRAERAAGTDLRAEVDSTPYRGDLDAAVRPRRAISAPDAPRVARPEEPRPAPLKLVAEQRVDAPRRKVRPRRVTTPSQTGVIEPEDKGFTGFAEELGATDLPDLLEAAAAYLADVEGRNQFSRPMLMGKLREVGEEGFSREDGQRSFGQLLREGKLQKLSGGRFTVTGETEFRSAARRRAG